MYWVRENSFRCIFNRCLIFFLFNTEQHPISSAIDGTNNWWQSPSIQNGRQYHWVTITLDLRQVSNIYLSVCHLLNVQYKSMQFIVVLQCLDGWIFIS